ncbi:aldo/keto reductase [Tamilnaduibacter salinus]|uniref:Aldo/keto reductase n=1 Tax=Tamilnaduibacter salinus TaxID=1484056 RepID=A0A2A2I276_9GAMM|nr:aldo/keto reductase [Tamilnaduibacter salinus]PAV25829.1 aldo/keto reductase [Tamilnaduibacter salinus]
MTSSFNRRTFLTGLSAAGAASLLPGSMAFGQAIQPAQRPIPSTVQPLPIVGLGSWITFNVGDDPALLEDSAAVMGALFQDGGRMIDCSPMYGSSQNTIGYGLDKLGHRDRVFSTDKVWTGDVSDGREQIQTSRENWRIPQFDLLQVHNLVAWRGHLRTLREMKDDGRLRYIGITTSHGRRHDLMERIMREEPIDFIQLTYNILDRAAEDRLLPLARDKGIAVIANRPYQRGALLRKLDGHALPDSARDTGARSWAQFTLQYLLSHPAITCAIPATTRVDHVRENLATAAGALPDARTRQRMARDVRSL